MKLTHFLILFLCIQAGQSVAQSSKSELEPFATPYSPTHRPRMVAEWEPAVGVIVAWPPSIPHQLIIELAKDSKLYLLIANREARQDAVNWFTKWGIYPDRVKFITAPQGIDVSWTRDWGPHAVFTESGSMKMADGKYLYATPVTGLSCEDSLRFLYYDDQHHILQTTIDDHIPSYIAAAADLDMINLPFAFTGGNVFSDGQRTAFSSCALTNENRYTGVSDEKFFHDTKQLLGIEHYNVISNFEEEGIQHIDCYLKLLDEERILVMRPPVDHPAYAQYEGIIDHELSKLTNAFGRPYQILRLDTDRYRGDKLAAYSNSLILNKTIYVPLFDIPQDTVALRQWREAMPGYTVKGFSFKMDQEPSLSQSTKEHYEGIGWNAGDALHCRTRAVWDSNMIYMCVDRVPGSMPKKKEYTVKVILKDYSKGSLVPESLKLIYRVTGKPEWKEIRLTPSGLPDQYSASIPGGISGVTVDYYVTAHSNWGTTDTRPRTAPAGWYQFKIE